MQPNDAGFGWQTKLGFTSRFHNIRFGLHSMMEVIGFLLLLVVVAIGSVRGRVAGEKPCLCTSEYKEVCGSDGVTYSNPCLARCSKVQVVKESPCVAKQKRRLATTSSDCACNRVLLRVCGSDGVTYDNPDCAQRCGNITDYVIGACYDACACSNDYDPVCHVITSTKYVNSCFAICLGADSTQLESCE